MAAKTFGGYQLIKKLATGGMSEVWLAQRRAGTRDPLVVKWILPHLASDPSFVQMLLNEARVAARLNHPGVAKVFDLGEADGTYYIAMEYIAGEDLGHVMRQAWKAGQWISHPVSMQIMSEACAALAYAHARTDDQGRPLRVVHRDVSPQNILLGFAGTVKLVDFGIAKATDLISTTEPGAIKGKFAYMSPEHSAGKPVDHRADIFSAGLVLYELLSGVRPLQRSTEAATHIAAVECQIEPPSSVSETPKDLDAVVMRALARAAEDRYATAAEFQRAIDEAMRRKGWSAGPDEISQLVRILFPRRLEDEQSLLESLLGDEDADEETVVEVLGGSRPGGQSLAGAPVVPSHKKVTAEDGVPASGMRQAPREEAPPPAAPAGDGEEEDDRTVDPESGLPLLATPPEEAITEKKPLGAPGGRLKRRSPSGPAPYKTGRDYPVARGREERQRPREASARHTRVASPRRLMVVDGVENDKGKVMPFPGVQMVVGRGDTCELRLEDPSVSRRHLELVLGPRGTYLRDLASDSGTRVNGKWVDERLLRHEDLIEIGVTRLQFLDEEEAARRTAEEAAAKAEEERKQQEAQRRQAEEEAAAAKAAEEQARAEEEERREAEEEERRKAEEEAAAAKAEEEAAAQAAEEKKRAEEERARRPVSAPPGISSRSWMALSPRQRLATIVLVPLHLALLVGGARWLLRPAVPEVDPAQVAAERSYEQARLFIKGGMWVEAVSSLEAAEKRFPGVDAEGLLPKAKKELEAVKAVEAARELLRDQRFEEARQRVLEVAPTDKSVLDKRERFLAELDEQEAASYQELRARDALLGGDLARARQLIDRLPDEPRMQLVKRLMAMEDEALTDAATAQQRAERQKYLATVFRTVERRFQARQFEGAVKDCDRVEEMVPGEMLVKRRAEELKKLIPQFQKHFEEGAARHQARKLAAAFGPLRRALQLYQEIQLAGPLGPELGQMLVEAAVASARDARARQDPAIAGMRYRDAAALAPKDPRVTEGLDWVARRAGKILADAGVRDRTRAPRLYVEKLELVVELTPRGSPENVRANEQLRAWETGARRAVP